MSEPLARTLFQESHPYHPAIYLDVDRVMVYGLNATLPERIDTWRAQGFKVALMIGLAWGSYHDYLDGQWDGVQHRAKVVQTTSDDKPILHGDSANVAYLVPTRTFQTYLIERLLPVVDYGVDEFFFEEPEFWVDAGYAPAFKRAWQERYQTEWQGQHTGAGAHWQAARLKRDLYLELYEGVARAVKEYGAAKGREVRCFVATHSLVNYAQWRIVSPESAFLRSDYCDGFIGQVWTGTSRTPNMLRGQRDTRTFFTALLEYGYFAALVKNSRQEFWALHDPIEDNPGYSWPEYRYHYLRTVVASLLRPEVSRFEICPWPNRIFRRAYQGQMIPEDYQIVLRTLFDAFRRMHDYQGSWLSEVPQVGLLVDDSALFQRPARSSAVKYDGTRDDSSFSAENQKVVCWNEFFGLALPLLEKGIMVTPVPLQTAALHREALQPYRVLVLSYQYMKPLYSVYHQVLAAWVKQGGTLLYVGDGQDAFQQIAEWWNDYGANSTTLLADLRGQLGDTGSGAGDTLAFGDGSFSEWRIDPASIAEDAGLADAWVEKVYQACGLTRDPAQTWLVRRGPYIAGMRFGRDDEEQTLKGHYVDLTQANLPISEDPVVPLDQPVLWYDLDYAQDQQIIATSVPLKLLETEQPSQIRYQIGAPAGIPAVARLRLSQAPTSLTLYDGQAERSCQWQWHEPSHTVYCKATPNHGDAQFLIHLGA